MIRALLALLLLAGCAQAEPLTLPTDDVEPTAEPTERPTPEPEPTERPTPEPTPVPTPAPLGFDEQLAAAETITYDELFRNSGDHVGKDIYFRGEIIQVLGEPGGFEFRISVTLNEFDFYEDPVYVFYYGTERFLEDDIVDFVGFSADVITYESTMGGDITIPAMIVDSNGMRLVP